MNEESSLLVNEYTAFGRFYSGAWVEKDKIRIFVWTRNLGIWKNNESIFKIVVYLLVEASSSLQHLTFFRFAIFQLFLALDAFRSLKELWKMSSMTIGRLAYKWNHEKGILDKIRLILIMTCSRTNSCL